MKKLDPVHPGEILSEEFLKPLHVSQYRLAKDLGISAPRISEIIKGRRAITADTALRLSRYFGMSKGFWLGLQKRYELDIAEDNLAERLKKEVHPFQPDCNFKRCEYKNNYPYYWIRRMVNSN